MSEHQTFNSAFYERLKTQIQDADKLMEVLEGEPLTSIRLNPKFDIKIKGESVPWNSNGLYLSERPNFNNDPLYHAGAYYPMEASSMFLDYALKQIQLPAESVILDLCAAPGGKSLILKDHFPDHLLVSNEIDGKRVHVLKENVIKWGKLDHMVVQSDAEKLKTADLRYGLVVVDAPCSGEGLFRKDKASRGEWTMERAAGCAVRQNHILNDAVELVEPGGYMIYSTCTYNPQENMEQIERLVNEFGMKPVELSIDRSFAIDEVSSGDIKGYQFWPHRVKGEGFFIAVLKKVGEPLTENPRKLKFKTDQLESDLVIEEGRLIQNLEGRYYLLSLQELHAVDALKKVAKIIKKGVFLGEIKGLELIPSYDASHQPSVIRNYPHLDLDQEQAKKYLQGNALMLPAQKGPIVLTYNGLALGMGKSNGSRINNLYPKHLRIT